MEKALISLIHNSESGRIINHKKFDTFFHSNGFPAETYKEPLSLINGDIQNPLSVIGTHIPEVKEG